VLATVTDRVSSVAVDDTNVYFTVGLHQVSAVPKAGGAVRTLTTSLPLTFIGTTAMVADGGTLYLAGSNAIYALPTAGGDATTLTTGVAVADSLALDAEFLEQDVARVAQQVVVAQAVVVALLSVGLAAVPEALMAPAAAMSVEVPAAGYLVLPLVALVIGALASAAALRRAIRIDPALAFGA